MHLGMAIDGVGPHRAADPGAVDPAAFVALAQAAEAGCLDFVLLDDSFVGGPAGNRRGVSTRC